MNKVIKVLSIVMPLVELTAMVVGGIVDSIVADHEREELRQEMKTYVDAKFEKLN